MYAIVMSPNFIHYMKSINSETHIDYSGRQYADRMCKKKVISAAMNVMNKAFLPQVGNAFVRLTNH